MIEINWDKYLDFDAQTPPPEMREIIFVHGTPYEMGKQYGSQTREMIKRNFCLVLGDALKNYTREQIVERVTLLSRDIAEKAPDIDEWYRGIADGAGMSYGDIALINIQLWVSIPYLMCSTIAATGSATKDGKTIVGVNGDVTYNMSGYGVTLAAFPKEGNAFVTLPQLAGQLGSNFAMNEKGLIITFDGGESELPEDTRFGFADFIGAMVHAAAACDTSVDAEESIKELGIAGGWIYTFADTSKDIRILEYTSSRNITRVPGDYGEKDYIHAANHFLDKDMRRSSIEGEMNMDSYTRYDTEEKMLADEFGMLDLEYMMSIMASHDWWDGKQWHKEQWGVLESNFTPEMHAPDFRTGTRCFGIAEDAAAYILHGSVDTAVSYIPRSKGKYTRILVKGNPEDTLYALEEDAVMAAWSAAGRIAQGDRAESQQLELVDQAKKHIFAGKNYLAKLNIYKTFDAEKTREHFGYAASEFSRAYIISQLV